jgi:hypothetical protein
MAENDRESLEARTLSLRQELQPQGAVEEVIFQQVAHAVWNLERLSRLETALAARDPNYLISDEYARLLKMRGIYTQSFQRNIKGLEEHRKHRAKLAKLRAAKPQEKARPARVSKLIH